MTKFAYDRPGVRGSCTCPSRSSCSGCPTYEKNRRFALPPSTNNDRIQAMSIEERAKLLRDIAMEAMDSVMGERKSGRFPISSSVGEWLEWLEREADI